MLALLTLASNTATTSPSMWHTLSAEPPSNSIVGLCRRISTRSRQDSAPISQWRYFRQVIPSWRSATEAGGSAMDKFIIEAHFRLQEWVAEEKGYFTAEGLDYEFREFIKSTGGQHHNKAGEGALQSIGKGREAQLNCGWHLTVNVAAS